jgi:hypothetical protein
VLGVGVLVAYMISNEKTEATYRTSIETTYKETNFQWHPQYCKCDFEKAIHQGTNIKTQENN